MTDEPKEADSKVQFGNLPPVDTVAEEKGANNVSAGGVSEDADRDKDGEPTVEMMTEMDQEAAIEGEAKRTEEEAVEAEEEEEEEDEGGVSAGDVSEGGVSADAVRNKLRNNVQDIYDTIHGRTLVAALQATGGARFIQPPPPHREDRVSADKNATGVDTEAEDPARRGGAVDSLNSLSSSTGK